MKALSLPFRTAGSFEAWAQSCFDEIQRASAEDVQTVLLDYTITGSLTQQRTINAGTGTLTDVRNVLCTLITDIQKQGQKRQYG